MKDKVKIPAYALYPSPIDGIFSMVPPFSASARRPGKSLQPGGDLYNDRLF